MHKRKRRKNKLPKKKATLSQDYRIMEQEVNSLLESKFPLIDDKSEVNKQIEFFTENIQKPEDSADSQKEEDGASEEASVSVGETLVLPIESYIKIEITAPVKPVKAEKVEADAGLLFIPASKEVLPIEDVESQRLENLEKDGLFVTKPGNFKSKNMFRMASRYYEESNVDTMLSLNCLKNTREYCQNTNLYKTECSKTFEPIFYKVPYFQEDKQSIINNKRILTISLQSLQFSEHPLQTDEHSLSMKLEEIFDAYKDRKSQNILQKTASELIAIRRVINDLLNKCDEEDVEQLEKYIEHARMLRNSLHREELIQKNLIKNALESWVSLKSMRKSQGFNWTTVKLLIKTEELNPSEEEKVWNERFKVELNEILREEFGVYYKQKRNRRQDDLRKPNVEQIKAELHDTLSNCSRLPNEPKIDLDLGKISGPSKAIERSREYFVKIFLDDQFVECTKQFQMSKKFNIPINQSFSVILEKRIPESIRIEIYEARKFPPDTKIASLFLPVGAVFYGPSKIHESLHFVSKNLKIKGKLKVFLSCDDVDPPHLDTDQGFWTQRAKRQTEIPKTVLKDWYDNHFINPQDPDCIPLVGKLNEPNMQEQYNQDDGGFILNEQQLCFCPLEHLENNQRLRLLKLRYRNDMKYKNFKFVPIYENEFEDKSEEKVIEEGNWINPIDLQRHNGKKYLRKLYETVENHCRQLSKSENGTFNLLIGNDIPTFSSIMSTILAFFGPSRPLNPPKTPPPSVQLTECSSFNIVVNVVRAIGVPVRNFQVACSRRDSGSSSIHHTLKYTNVNPFVCVTYQDKIYRTITAEGSNPTWNEQLVLRISGNPNEFKDDVIFKLFDEYVEDLINDDTSRAMEVYQRIHTNWLGEFRIPLSSIFLRQSIEGVFELNSPKILLGYSKPSLDLTADAESSVDIPEIREIVYLSLYINIEPQFELPKLSMSSLECSELKEVKMHIQQWCLQVKEICPQHFIDPLISLASGKRVCITRLLEPIPLPIESSETVENYIKRYVSLIPILKTSNQCMNLDGVWLNNQIILDTSWAFPKDLGVILACYYLSIGIKAWLALGIVLPYGESSVVLLKQDDGYVFVDPQNASKYSTKEVFSPVIRVYYVVGQDNVYCNLQSETRVPMIDFDLNNTSNWMPLFTRNNPAPIGGVHKINYIYKPMLNVAELRKNIERKIMKKISSWRSTRKTVWNRAFHGVMYEILNDLEQDVTSNREPEDYLKKLSLATPTHKLSGFTLNFTYTNLSSIAERVKSTGIHLNTDKNVEFSVVSYIHQYPNSILSIWIFLVSAIPIV